MGARKPVGKSKPTVAEAVTPQVGGRGVYLYAAAAFISLIGLADTIYLTVIHITGRVKFVPCNITGGCEDVLTSRYATIGGIPLAALGALAYFAAFSLSTLAAFGNRMAGSLLLYLAAFMLLFSIWLFYVQAFILHAFCQFCLLSATTSLLLTLLVFINRFYVQRPRRR